MNLKLKGNSRVWTPPRILALGYAVIILLGSFLLMLPQSHQSGEGLSFLNAFFTATSATCVTGLVVVDTGTFFTPFGQTVIMCLIQIGGLGFMTMATLIALVFRRRISLRERLILQESMNQGDMEGIVRLIKKVLYYSFAIELVGAIVFSLRLMMDHPPGQAVFFGIFHAVSLFNNAGFDLFGEYRSLTGYVADPVMNLVAILLIVLGGLGFVVLSDLIEFRKNRRLSLHTKSVLLMTGILLAAGFVLVLVFEFTNPGTLGKLSWGGKFWASLFHSTTTRTAGANTVDLTQLRQATLLLTIIFMFIGGSPGSTAGGVKTTTILLMFGAVLAMLRGRKDVVLFRFRLGQERIFKALTIVVFALVLVITATMILSMTESTDFLTVLFEATSAFGTVGLSLGLTPHLTVIGKLLICLLMFAGRVGLITLAYALAPKQEKEPFRYAEGKIMIG
ncbi:TrkH family potassium uptake protein [Paenibacillus bovis]|uniref:Trk family potassium uptake protein n=1 Tax=Paenibacillus bovis TaxID=1616788 RepID=A0A172ZMX9_9BACL|nr:TrkH family potassium uptake protein [Paenibacillus bovis]ANF98933.1 Trk family potassium uptake protein [Paenibacillus bovis]